jgi:hypothetical protein
MAERTEQVKTTVIDVGCARWGGDYSIERLIEMYYPDMLYGFDPAWPEDEPNVIHSLLHPTTTFVERAAAWTYDGEVRFLVDGLNGQVGDAGHWPLVPCIDLARFIDQLPTGRIVLKLDAEGAEIELLEHLIATTVDVRLTGVIVDWHPWNDPERRRAIERALTCSVEEWRW